MSLLSQTYSFKVTRDATGLPTGVGTAVKEDMLSGTIKGITAPFTSDDCVVGLGRTIATALFVYAGAQASRKMIVGSFAFNPLKA